MNYSILERKFEIFGSNHFNKYDSQKLFFQKLFFIINILNFKVGIYLITAILFFVSNGAFCQNYDSTFIQPGAFWKYNDSGANLGSSWKFQTYSDSSWSQGQAELGYGDGNESTIISFGNNSLNKHITSYFRKFIYIGDTIAFKYFKLKLIADDGAIVYLNNDELIRKNLPNGPINYKTKAINAINGSLEHTWSELNVNNNKFVIGWNLIAVEIHQCDSLSDDVSFALELKGITYKESSLIFNGSNNYVNLGQATNLNSANFTIECWLKRTGTGISAITGTGNGVTGITAVPIVTKGRDGIDGTIQDINYFIGIHETSSRICVDLEEGTGQLNPGKNHPAIGNTQLLYNVWYHLAVTYDGIKWRIYINGILDNEVLSNCIPQFNCTQPAGIGTSFNQSNLPEGYFAGLIDEIRIWNYARTQIQIYSNMSNSINLAQGLIGNFKLNEGEGLSVKNSVPPYNLGTLVNNPTWTSGTTFSSNLPPIFTGIYYPIDTTAFETQPPLVSNIIDPENKPLKVTFWGRIQPSNLDSPSFTLIPIPDTQYYTQEFGNARNSTFKEQMNWIVTNRKNRNIKHVIHLGDCVENGDNGGNDIEWKRADTAFSIIENPNTTNLPNGIPYNINVGNHDQGPNGNGGGPTETTTFFNQYFGINRFLNRNYYGGHYGNKNNNNFSFFTASGLKFISIALEYDTNADSLVLNWADSLLAKYSDYRGIVSSHWIINSDGSFSNQGLKIFNKLKYRNNFHLMLCGHIAPGGEAIRTDYFNGRRIYTILSNYQDRTGGNGWLRIMEFKPSEDKIYISTYSPKLNAYETDANSQFSLFYPMRGEFNSLGTVNIASGASATINWPSILTPNTKYDWFVEASDSINFSFSKLFKFSYKPIPKIIKPNNTSIWKANATNEILFDNKYLPNLEISYKKENGSYYPISNSINGKSFTWNTPDLSQGNYILKIRHSSSAANLYDTSERFIIYNDSLIKSQEDWKYYTGATSPGANWKDTAFNDSMWRIGLGQFGYGDGDENTIINACGQVATFPTCTNKYISSYYRKWFYVLDKQKLQKIMFGLIRDDGAVVYLNNQEIYRTNLPTGSISHNTLANNDVVSHNENKWIKGSIPVNYIKNGWNLISVEIHQVSPANPDISFDFKIGFDSILSKPIEITSPNLEDTLYVGSSHNVTWVCDTSISKVTISYSSNNGVTWNNISQNIDSKLGSFLWQIQPIFSNYCIIRIVDTALTQNQDITQGNFIVNNLSLPIKLLYFNGKKVENMAMLKWATSFEKNNNYFIVERSYDGTTFDSIGMTPSIGNNNNITNYQFIDFLNIDEISEIKNVYYRIKLIDFDNSKFLSKIVTISLDEKSEKEFSVFPNPTSSNVNVVHFENNFKNADLTITNIQGQIMKVISIDSNNSISINLEPGIYFFTLTKTDGTHHTEKVIFLSQK